MPRKGERLEHTASSCTAKTRDGDLCKNPPMLASRTCRMHGSSTKTAREAAARRLEDAVDRLLYALIRIAEDENQPGGARVAAIKDALDRAGFGKERSVTVKLQRWEENFAGLLVDLPHDIVEAELVDDALPPPSSTPAAVNPADPARVPRTAQARLGRGGA